MHESNHQKTLTDEIVDITNQDPSLCYQCGKCSAGCPMHEYMDISPNKIVRLIQLGLYEAAFKSHAIWLCAGCLTCSARCPKSFNLAYFIDALRELAIHKGYQPADKDVYAFHKSFLSQVKRHGRLYEMGLIRDFKLRTFRLLQDIDVAPTMFLRGKIGILPHNIKNKDAVKRIFDNVEKIERDRA